MQVFVPNANASSTNETARYLDSHLVHTGRFFSTDALNAYVGHQVVHAELPLLSHPC